MKKHIRYLLFFGFWTVLIVSIYIYGKIRKNEMEDYKQITIGKINDFGNGGSGTVTLHFTFTYNNKIYFSKRGSRIARVKYNYFDGKYFPVIFSSIDPDNNKLLVFPDDFKSWEMPFPDSLNWVIQYQKW